MIMDFLPFIEPKAEIYHCMLLSQPCVHADAAVLAAAATSSVAAVRPPGGSSDLRSLVRTRAGGAGGVPSELWGQLRQEQESSNSAGTGHPLSGAFPTSLWSSGGYSNGVNGTHQMW